jgi:hypothetical protein
MNLSTLRTKVIDWLNNTSISASVVTDCINMAIHDIEKGKNWQCMEEWKYVTSTEDRISCPAYKEIIWFKIKQDGIYSRIRKYINSGSLLENYSSETVTGTPEAFATIRATDEFIVRPYPSQSFSYEIYYYKYTADLVNDGDENYWTNNQWELILYGSLLKCSEYLTGANADKIKAWKNSYESYLSGATNSEMNEKHGGSELNMPAFEYNPLSELKE